MAIMARDERPPRENAKTGLTHAVCCMVKHAGIDRYKDGPWREKVWIAFELDQRLEDGRPFMLSNFYTNSMFEKANLRRDLEGMLGRGMTDEEVDGVGYNLLQLVGKHFTINVVEDGEYRRIGSLAPPMEGKPDLTIANTEPPEWVQKRIDEGLENMKREWPKQYKEMLKAAEGEAPF